jgi:hypothetical protein
MIRIELGTGDPKLPLTDEQIEQARVIISDIMGVPLDDVQVEYVEVDD